ncbi:MAG: hypothetical protein ACW99R_04665 [Candidatus Hodarchaeales archaeon]
MTDLDFQPVAWVSLASLSGLSLVSLGQPGLKSVDEQVYTGGLTAVQQMLGGEIGGDTSRFVGGSHNNKTGRFLVKTSNFELVGQFLLISRQHVTVAPVLVDYYEQLVTIFAEETLKTDLVERAEKEFTAFSVSDVIDFFLSSIKKARKKISIPHNDNLFSQSLTESMEKSISDYEYSRSLVKISNLKGKFHEVVPTIQINRTKFLDQFITELTEFLVSEYPHSVVMYSKAGSLSKEVKKYVEKNISNLKFDEALHQVIRDFEENDLTLFLEDFSLHEVTKKNLRSQIEDAIFRKYLSEYPILFLAEPQIGSFETEINNLTTRINENYDIGGTLSRIAEKMIDDEIFAKLLIPYIRFFCDEFSAGLTPSAWKYMQIVFKLISNETKIDILDVLPDMKDEIPPSHFSTIEKMMTKYKLSGTKLSPLTFTVKKASDVLPFYRALFSSLAFGVNAVISELAFNEDNPTNLLETLNTNLDILARDLHISHGIFKVYSYLESIKTKIPFSLAFADDNSTSEKIMSNQLTIEELMQSLIEANVRNLTEEQTFLKNKLSSFRSEFDVEIKNILKYLSLAPKIISKGYNIKIANLHSLKLTTKPISEVDTAFTKNLSDFDKLISDLKDNLRKIRNGAIEFDKGNIKEQEFNKVMKNQKFITETQKEFQKIMERMEATVTKSYNNVSSVVERQLKSFSKELSKRFMQACNFLNINRKNLTNQDAKLISVSSNSMKNIQKSIKQSFEKDRFFEFKNVGQYYLYAKYRSLPSNLHSEVLEALVKKQNYPFLKESITKISPTSDILRSYAKVLEAHAYELLSDVFSSSGRLVEKGVFKSDQEVKIVIQNNIPIPTIEVGYLTNERAVKSLKTLFGTRIVVETEKSESNEIYRILTVVPNFQCDYSTMKHFWETKDWTLKKTVITLSWFSLLAQNEFYLNLLRFSSDLYSPRVRGTLEEIFDQIGKGMV